MVGAGAVQADMDLSEAGSQQLRLQDSLRAMQDAFAPAEVLYTFFCLFARASLAR